MSSGTIYSFVKLSLDEKSALVKEKGVFLENLGDGGNEINLYYLQGFFVEVEVNKLQNIIVDVTPFKQGYKLGKYKDQLSSLN